MDWLQSRTKNREEGCFYFQDQEEVPKKPLKKLIAGSVAFTFCLSGLLIADVVVVRMH